jgi:SAM-dependent methyltransferase/alkylhydroperoxidase family enzyme
MTQPGAREQWEVVDEGWGRRAVEFATLMEPSACREYVAMHHHLGVGAEDALLDMACGSGLAIELASLRGGTCAGIDASERLIAVARDRNPDADLRVGDMGALPWEDERFDVVTSFRGIWGTTPGAIAEALRVLRPGGRLGLTVWGHIKASPGAWAMTPFQLASTPKVENQAAMVSLGRPGAGESLLADVGFADVRRVNIEFVFEFADPDAYARALSATGPAFEAIQSVGEDSFLESAASLAREYVRDGLPLRAQIALVGYLASKPSPVARSAPPPAEQDRTVGFLGTAARSAGAQRLFEQDLSGEGYLTNVSRLWAHQPDALEALSALMGEATQAASLTLAQRAVLVAASAWGLGDSFCSMAWGKRLADATNPEIAAAVLGGDVEALGPEERALARWARLMATDPNAVVEEDVQSLRDLGFEDAQILALSIYVGLRLAFSTVNDALGAAPDEQLAQSLPAAVRAAVRFGRSPDPPGR